jgi:hypothetical protein
MTFLVRHPDTPAGAIEAIDARLERVSGGAVATFIVRGDLRRLIVPASTRPVRTDGLWRTTCFELFVGGEDGVYREFNFSSSGAWAAYDFTGYRKGMREGEADVLIRVDREDRCLILLADVKSEIPAYANIGLTAVIEETDGVIRYWATSFEPGKPDFHAPGVRSLLLGEVEAE